MINYWYRTGQNEDHKAWYVEILANSDLIRSYENCSTEEEAAKRAESFIDGVKFARCE